MGFQISYMKIRSVCLWTRLCRPATGYFQATKMGARIFATMELKNTPACGDERLLRFLLLRAGRGNPLWPSKTGASRCGINRGR